MGSSTEPGHRSVGIQLFWMRCLWDFEMEFSSEPGHRSGEVPSFSMSYLHDKYSIPIGDGTPLRGQFEFVDVLSMDGIFATSTSNEHSTNAWRSQRVNMESVSINCNQLREFLCFDRLFYIVGYLTRTNISGELDDRATHARQLNSPPSVHWTDETYEPEPGPFFTSRSQTLFMVLFTIVSRRSVPLGSESLHLERSNTPMYKRA